MQNNQNLINNLSSKRVIDITADELATLVVHKLQTIQPPKAERKLVRGIRGIMEVLGCSRTKAASLSASGILEDAIVSRSNRLVIYDANLIFSTLK